MKKSFRTAAVITMVAMMAAGTASAAGQKKGGDARQNHGGPNQHERQGPGRSHGMMPGFMPGMAMHASGDRTVVIGQVKSIDKNTGRLVLTNTDGKDVEISTTPFTFVMFEPDRSAKPNRNERGQKQAAAADAQEGGAGKAKKVGDITAGSWVIVTPFKTDTKSPTAQSIFVKKEAK